MGYTLLQFFLSSYIPNMRFKYLLRTIQGVSVSISSYVFMFLDISISTRTTIQPIKPNVLFAPEQCPVFCLNVLLSIFRTSCKLSHEVGYNLYTLFCLDVSRKQDISDFAK